MFPKFLSAYRIRSTQSRIHRLSADDGWPIALYEYEPSGSRRGFPILLCHGSFCRANFFDFGDGFGLAPWLASRGFHVFSLELRGRGRSVPSRSDRELRGRRWRWRIDDFVAYDLPAAIAAVLRLSEAAQLDYLGHSMGGIIGFAHLLRTADARVRRVIAAATFSPVTIARFGDSPRLLAARSAGDLLDVLPLLVKAMDRIPVHLATKVAAALAPDFALPFQPAMNARNMAPEVFRRYLSHAVVAVSTAKIQSMAHWFFDPHSPWKSASLEAYRHPTFWIAGRKDLLVPAPWVRADFMNAGGEAAGHRYVEFARNNGHSADYGHGDLMLGRHVEREVFPEIERWFAMD